MRETCFKLHGYPEWYKTLQEQRKKEQRKKEQRNSAHLVQNEQQPMPDTSVDTKGMLGNTNLPKFTKVIRQELLKLMKGKLVQDPLQVNFAHTTNDFADIPSTLSPIPMPTPIPDIEYNVQPSFVLHHSTVAPIPESLDSIHDTTTVIPETSIPSNPSIPSTRPQRTITKPAWLQNYVCSHSSHSSNLCFPRMFTPAHKLFLANVAAIQEPKSFAQANQIEDWRKAMQFELHALERNETWDLTTLPKGKKAIRSRWVYKVKLLPDGKRLIIIRLGSLLKATPKLKASHHWNKEFTTKLEAYGFRQSQHDRCLFLRRTSTSFLALLVYVDDILITGTSLSCIQDVNAYHRLLTIKDFGFARYFLGLEKACSFHGTYVTHRKNLHDILDDCKNARSVSTPLPSGIRFDNANGVLLSSPDIYWRLIGSLLYLGFSWQDICFAIQQLSQFLQHPREHYWDAAMHLLRYLPWSFFSIFHFSSLVHLFRLELGSIIGYCIILVGRLIFPRSTKSKPLCPGHLQRRNIAVWPRPFASCCESVTFSRTLGCRSSPNPFFV
ncbi:UNVERIFIED_CONTAM: Retrovirus-related Pol polyprotein from transposon RE2 [Sesamum radiatum]|uniref:Retrovirus-related Pol polyprotein from transposon RE2 n=1 Tax=Sesamum radiatum TaxID=300843 RepID=A0AAW2TLU6_SESRA